MLTILIREYEDLKRENAELRAIVQQLKEEISLLKGGKDSRTSSTAPSQDIGRSNKISLRTSSGKKSGGQSGHVGSTLFMSDTPDEVIDHCPQVCNHCGEDLQGVASTSFIPRQLVDLPSDISPLYIEHRSHVKICPSCKLENRGIFPDRLQAPIQYGSQVEAMAGYLSVYQSLPYQRICKLFKDFFKLPLSEGSIDTFLENLSQKSNEAYKIIEERLRESKVVGSDETGCRVGGKKHWFHVWQTPLLTFTCACAQYKYRLFCQPRIQRF